MLGVANLTDLDSAQKLPDSFDLANRRVEPRMVIAQQGSPLLGAPTALCRFLLSLRLSRLPRPRVASARKSHGDKILADAVNGELAWRDAVQISGGLRIVERSAWIA
jgi:hypothetical protein